MPRGRFISKSFYDNYRLNSMPIELHHLFGGINVVSADCEGRCKGSAKLINSQVLLYRNFTDEQVEAWLNLLWESKDEETGLGLIERYKVNSREYIWIPGFDKHQKGRNKEREAPYYRKVDNSSLPPPPDSLMSKVRKHIIEYKAEDKTQAEIKTDDLKVAGMIAYYQDQLGKMLTPHDYENLVDYADNYPDGWFEKAVDEAAKNGARVPMRYIEKIMENWREEGVDPLVKSGAKPNRGQPTSTEKLKASTTKKLR